MTFSHVVSVFQAAMGSGVARASPVQFHQDSEKTDVSHYATYAAVS